MLVARRVRVDRCCHDVQLGYYLRFTRPKYVQNNVFNESTKLFFSQKSVSQHSHHSCTWAWHTSQFGVSSVVEILYSCCFRVHYEFISSILINCQISCYNYCFTWYAVPSQDKLGTYNIAFKNCWRCHGLMLPMALHNTKGLLSVPMAWQSRILNYLRQIKWLWGISPSYHLGTSIGCGEMFVWWDD